jgi:hypothetical protein
MATAAVSSNSLYQELQTFFQQRGSDLQQLGQSLKSGDLAGAQKEYAALQALGQNGPFASGDAFKGSQRQQDLAAIGQALQSGNLAGAQQAFSQLQSTFHRQSNNNGNNNNNSTPAIIVTLSESAAGASNGTSESTAAGSTAAGSGASTSGTEIILNLGTVTPGEQITIGLSNAGNGTENVTIGVSGQQNQKPEQITLNLNPNSNQEIILNLFNSTASSTNQGSGLSVNA